MKKPILLFLLPLIFTWISCSNPQATNPPTQDQAESSSKDTTSKKAPKRVILFFGNSLTAGYGIDTRDRFTSLIQARLDSLGYNYEVINSGVSGETKSTGSNRVGWVVERQDVDIFILELGANDGLRGIPTKETEQNLITIIDKVKEIHPDTKIILAGMMIPPNMGPDYSNDFKNIFPNVAKKKNVTLLPFLLEGVAGDPKLNLPDGIHPTPEGHKIVTENVWEVLEKELVK
ncbi:MAG TPA: arylesterase [Bacteroidia bacterium]|nr:arylesterase [Bacteroidia bacterium]